MARLSRWPDERQLGATELGKDRFEQFLCELPRRQDGNLVCSRRTLTQEPEVLEEHGLVRVEAKKAHVSPSKVLLGG